MMYIKVPISLSNCTSMLLENHTPDHVSFYVTFSWSGQTDVNLRFRSYRMRGLIASLIELRRYSKRSLVSFLELYSHN